MIDLTAFRARFPEYSDDAVYTDPFVQIFIDDALADVSQTKFKEAIADRITAYLAAHYLTIAVASQNGNTGSTAPIASQSVGEISVSYAVNSAEKGSDAYFNSTIYGQQYLSLLRRYCPGILTLNG